MRKKTLYKYELIGVNCILITQINSNKREIACLGVFLQNKIYIYYNMNNANYNIFSIRTYNNDKLVFYNSTKRKKISDILSSYKTRYKRFQNNKDNWLNVFYLLEQDKAYIKIEEQLTNSNDEIVKSLLCDYIAKNECINKLNIDEINKLCNKETEKENQIVLYEEPKKEIKEEPKKEIKEEIIKTINEIKKDKEIKLIEEPKKDEEIKLTKLYNDENFEPSKDEEKIKTINELKKDEEIKLIEETKITNLKDIKNIKSSSYKSKSSTSSVSSSSTSSHNDYIRNIKKTKTMKNSFFNKKKNRTLKMENNN